MSVFLRKSLIVSFWLVIPVITRAQVAPTPDSTKVSVPARQTDYLITNAGDTLRGIIRLTSGYARKGVRLKAKKSKARTYTPGMLRSVQLKDGQLYQKRLLPTGQSDSTVVLLQQLISGHASLYRFKEVASRYKNIGYKPELIQYYLSNGTSLLFPVVKPYYSSLQSLLLNCSELTISELKLTERELGDVVLKYDTICHSLEPFKDHRAKPNKFRILIGARAGVQQGKLFFGNQQFNLSKDQVKSYNLPTYALEAGIYFGAHWSLISGLEFAKHQNSFKRTILSPAYTVNANQALTITPSASIQTSMVPFVLRYTMGRRRLRPFLAAGGLIGKAKNGELNISTIDIRQVGRYNTIYRADVVNKTLVLFEESDRIYGSTIRAGLTFNGRHRLTPTLEVNYSAGHSKSEDLHFRTLGVSAGLAF